MSVKRAALLATACLLPLTSSGFAQTHGRARAPRRPATAAAVQPAPAGDVVQSIRVVGNQRIEAGTIESYLPLRVGDRFTPDALDRSLKALYATGLFHDVKLAREGNTLVVQVAENPIVNRVAFEGNHKLNDQQLRDAVHLRARSVYTPAEAEADRQRILDLYAHNGRYGARVEPQIIRLPDNRVDVVFEINEGSATLISRITFVGNHAFGEGRLREVIDSREQAFWRILSTSDVYDPDRINFDKELLRRFYLRNGFADFEVRDVTAELSPDRNSFFLTFVLHEGERYHLSKVSVDSHIPKLSSATLQSLVQLSPGDLYNGDAVERSVNAIQIAAQNRGYAFAEVHPRIARDPKTHTVELVFDVVEGPRVYIERIDINGNLRTEDKVIRREFTLAEGDPFNADALRRTRQQLQDLGYFNKVDIKPVPGSAPDKAILDTTIQEKATGELTIGGGYSTDAGALADLGLHERNFIGTGIDAGINTIIAQKRTEINLSVTDPYFLDRNLVTGFDLFHVDNNNQDIANYSERRTGASLRLGYRFNEHLSQAWTYSIVDRNVYNVTSGASLYVLDQQGRSILSQIGQTLTLDYRDSKVDPHEGFVVRAGTDFAGLGGDARYIRGKLDGSYYIPLDRFTGDSDWTIALSAGVGYLWNEGRPERIIDRFFLGGDNLRGFESGGVGPHSVPTPAFPASDSIGGRFIWTQSTELRFPLPISPDLGISGRAFVDVGALSQANKVLGQDIYDNSSPRVGAGVGISWRTPFGLINIDVAEPVVKYKYDQTQLLRFGFGTRF